MCVMNPLVLDHVEPVTKFLEILVGPDRIMELEADGAGSVSQQVTPAQVEDARDHLLKISQQVCNAKEVEGRRGPIGSVC